MVDADMLNYVIKDPVELNLSYMPFIKEGGLFVPTPQVYNLGDRIALDLQLPGKKEALRIEGKVIWITPRNALHHVLPGIGIQFIGSNAQSIRGQIENQLVPAIEVGGYTYGITEEIKKVKK